MEPAIGSKRIFGKPTLEAEIKQLGRANVDGKIFGPEATVKVIFHEKNK